MKKVLTGIIAIVVIGFISITMLYGQASTQEIEALTALYNATDGNNWNYNTNWLNGDPCMNNWYGVTCNTQDQVTQLYLDYNQLSGNIPSEIGNLTNLEYLYLSSNELSGNIPAEIGNLTNLTGLDLSSNELSGNIPSEISNLTNLQLLYLSGNQLCETSDPSVIAFVTQYDYWPQDCSGG